MLQIVMRLEQSIPRKELDKYAANTPYVARIAPSKIEDDFRSTIVTGGDNGGVVFIVECGRAEIDKADLCIEQDFAVGKAAVRLRGGRGNVAIVGEGLVAIMYEKYVLRLEIGMYEVEVMEN